MSAQIRAHRELVRAGLAWWYRQYAAYDRTRHLPCWMGFLLVTQRELNVRIVDDIRGLRKNPLDVVPEGDRFPNDFMLQLDDEESASMRSQFVTASRRNIRHRAQFKVVFESIKKLLAPPPAPPKRRIGFVTHEEKK